MSVNVANLFDRNPLHVAHLQGPVDRLPDANLRPVYERAGKILLIQRWKEPKSGESHAFLLFETEQAAMACCSRIGALRVTSDRQNSRPITVSALSCANATSNAVLNQWLHSQHMVPSYVMKNPPPAPPSASFPLACLTPLTENCGLVVQMLREHKCALSWWRFVAQMYVANKMWTPAQFILGHSTKSEEGTDVQTVKGKEKDKENQTIEINTTAEDIIDISDDSVGENMSESEDDQNPDFARAQKLQKEAMAPTQPKAPPTGPRRFGNAWLPHKRPNVQNARAKLGIVPVKPAAKSSTAAEKSVEKSAAPTLVQAPTPAQTPATVSAPPVPTPASGLAVTEEPTPAVPKDAESGEPSNLTAESPAPPSTPAPSSAPAPPEISPPFVPTPMSASPEVTRPPPSASPSLPSTPTPAPAPVNNSSLPRPPPTLPPPPTALAALPTPPKTSASTPTRPASQTSSRAPSQTPSRQASQAPARPSTTSPASASKPVLNPPSSPSLPAPPSRGSTSPSRPPPRGPSLASLIRPKTTELGLAKIPQNAEAFQVQQRVQANMVVPDATGASASAVAAAAVTGSSTSANTAATTGVLPALPAGMPQRPSWIPTGSANTSGTQESGPSASSSPSKPTNSMPAPAVPATVTEKADDIPSVEMAPPEAAIESPNLDEMRTADHTDRQMSDVEDLRPTHPEDQHPTQPEGQQPTIEPEDQRPKELIDQRGPPRSTPKKRSRWFLSDDKEETPSSSSPGLVVRTESLSSVDALVVEPESLVVEPEPHLFGSSLTSPVISSSLTSPHSTPAKRKSELDTRGFEARLKKRRHRESRSDTESAQANSSVPDLPAYGSGPTLPDSVFGVSLPGVESGLTATLAVIPPETYGRTSEEPSTPKSAFRTRLVDSSAQRPRRSRSPLPVRIERPVASGTRTAEEAALENELRLARRTSLSDMDPRTWKATLDENEALKMKIRVLELTLPTAESVKSELHAERKEKTQLIESLEIERSLLVQSEALRKHSDTTRKELETRISQLEDRLSDSASALEHARESAHVAAEQRRRAEEASRIADSERSKVGVLLDAERALVNTERAALAKEREGRAEVEAKCAGVEARLAAEQRRYAEASEVARKELSEAKDFLDAEKALSGAQEAMLAHERELKDEVEAKLDEAEARAAQYAEEKKAAEIKLDKELERAGKLLNAERALVAKERMTIAEERDTRSKLDKQLKAAQYQAASHKDRMTKADGLLTVVTEQLAKSNEQLAAANAKVVEVENQLGLSVKAVVAARAQVTSLEEQLSTANGSLATTTELLAKAQGELATNITQLATTKEQLTMTTVQLTAMKEQLSATEQREQGIKVNLLSWHRQLAIARDQTAAMERRTRLAEEKAATMELAQQSRTTDLARLKQVLESEQEVLMMERATLARERLLRKETEKKLVSAEERLVALDKHASDTRLQMQDNRSTNDGSSEQMQTQRTLMHMARMRIQELEQAVQRIEADLDASRSAEATAKTMIQLGWGSMRPRLESSPMSDMDPEFPDVRPDAMDEDSETGNPFMSLMKPPRQQSFKLKRTAVPARLLKVDMPSGECVNIDLGGLPSNAGAVVDLLHKSKCAGVFWDIIMDEYGAMGCFEAAEAIAVGKLKYQP